ncbi:MAG: acyl-ACP--UDP-N-acetylglucosamine O-acyltransferase [Proteobacteria bacterium]|nr:acyl-ACP--UDP-N-acetylglucosamine O-acyltransferase [Pseudomonadota bacterium]
MARIHPTAFVESGAALGEGVQIGPYCIVSAEAKLGDGVVLDSHVVIAGRTTIGPNNRIFPFAAIGTPPQDTKYAGESSELILGANNIIREHVTMHPGTSGGGLITRVGNNCLFMVGAHLAHDCQIGDHVILVNNVILGGHVEVQDHAILGGMSAVHQFVRIGRHAMIGGKSAVESDVIPYGSVLGNRAYLSGLNIIGLKRRGFGRDEIHGLRAAYRLLFAQEGTMQERLVDVAAMFANHEQVMEIVAFIQAHSSRALCQPKLDRAA